MIDQITVFLENEKGRIAALCRTLGDANINMAANALTKYLNVKYGKLLDEYSIRYENKAKHAGRQVVLTFTPTGESKNKS